MSYTVRVEEEGGKRRREGRGGRSGEEKGARRKEGRGGRNDEESEKMEKWKR